MLHELIERLAEELRRERDALLSELKEAMLESFVANLGADVTPAAWIEGDLDTMAIQFLDEEARASCRRPSRGCAPFGTT